MRSAIFDDDVGVGARAVARRAGRIGLLLVLALVPAAMGQAANPSIALFARQYGVAELAPGATSGSLGFTVDQATALRFDVVYATDALVTTITGPGGEIITPTTVASFGGEFGALEGVLFDGPSMYMAPLLPGHHSIYAFPSLGPGTYTLAFSDPSVSEETPVTVELALDSQLNAALFSPTPTAIDADGVVVIAALYDGDQPVTGADVTARVTPPNAPAFAVDLHDDGDRSAGDWMADDGLYSAHVAPTLLTEPGVYEVAAYLEKLAPDGMTKLFERHVGTDVTVVHQAARMDDGGIADASRDDDGDGCADRLVISVPVTASNAGLFQLEAVVETASGASLLAVGRMTLDAGPGSIETSLDAAELRDVGEAGPYAVTEMQLVFLGEDGAVPADRLVGALHTTAAYPLAEFACLAAPLPARPEHFACYEAEGTVDRRPGIAVLTPLGDSTVEIVRAKRLCNPANTDGEDPGAATSPDHLVGYVIRQTAPVFTPVVRLEVANEFGAFVVNLRATGYLLVPAAKSLLGPPAPLTSPIVDHFRCYKVQGGKIRRHGGVQVEDQFGIRTVRLKRARWVCLAADKNDEGVLRPADALMCFRSVPTPAFRGPPGPVFVEDQLGPASYPVNRATELCVTSVITSHHAVCVP